MPADESRNRRRDQRWRRACRSAAARARRIASRRRSSSGGGRYSPFEHGHSFSGSPGSSSSREPTSSSNHTAAGRRARAWPDEGHDHGCRRPHRAVPHRRSPGGGPRRPRHRPRRTRRRRRGDRSSSPTSAPTTPRSATVVAGADAIVHLAAIAAETSFEEALDTHVRLTHRVLEAAVAHGVGRVVYASSNHAVGFTPRAGMVGVDTRIRPDSFYGVGKAAAEALCSLYHDRHGLAVACLRIGSFRPRPDSRRGLATWLSPGDAVRLVDACLRAPDLGFAIVYGISANTRALVGPVDRPGPRLRPAGRRRDVRGRRRGHAGDRDRRPRRPLPRRQLHPPLTSPTERLGRDTGGSVHGTRHPFRALGHQRSPRPSRVEPTSGPRMGPLARVRRDMVAARVVHTMHPRWARTGAPVTTLLLLHLVVGARPSSPSRRGRAARPSAAFARRRGPVRGHARLAPRRPPRRRRRRGAHRARRVDPRARRQPRPPPRRVRRPDAAARRRHRRARGRLRVALLPPPDAGRRAPARAARAVRRGDGRPRPRRRPARALRVLGADVDHVVPAHRQQAHRRRRPAPPPCRRCSSPGSARWRCSAGFIVLGQAAGTYQLSAILADPPCGHGRRRSPSC